MIDIRPPGIAGAALLLSLGGQLPGPVPRSRHRAWQAGFIGGGRCR